MEGGESGSEAVGGKGKREGVEEGVSDINNSSRDQLEIKIVGVVVEKGESNI